MQKSLRNSVYDTSLLKTFKLFPYVPDDADILIIEINLMSDLINELKKRGYFIRKIGTPEVTIRKVANKTYVDLDIHHKVVAGVTSVMTPSHYGKTIEK